MKKLLLVDLDGTIREPIEGKFVDSPQNQRVISGADKALKHFADKGWMIVGISNQGGIEYGYKTLQSCIEEMSQTLKIFPELTSIYFCPDMAGNDCLCVGKMGSILLYSLQEKPGYSKCQNLENVNFRKPSTGMLMLAIESFSAQLAEDFIQDCEFYQDCDCWMIGDRPEDEEAAMNLGVKFMAADIFRNRFLPGMYEAKLSPSQVEFLEDIKLS